MEIVKKIEPGKQVVFIHNCNHKLTSKFTDVNHMVDCLIQM